MGKYSENPRCNVLSLRVSDQELEVLTNQSKQANMSISDLMREALYAIAFPEAAGHHLYNMGEK